MKARYLIAVVCLGALAACAGNRPPPLGSDDATKTVRQKFSAFDRHDVAAIQAIYGVDAVLHSPDYSKLKGNAPIASTYRQLFTVIPDAKDEVQSFDVIGDRVYVQFVLTGHWGGASETPVHARIMSVYTVVGGRITVDTTYYDRKAL